MSLKIDITHEEYVQVEEAAKKMWCSSKEGEYGKGILNSKKDPYCTERTGFLGEMAFGKLINQSPALYYIEHGDKYDFILKGFTLDIKTARSPHSWKGYIQVINEKGIHISLNKDVYVFCRVLWDDPLDKRAEIEVMGYQTRQYILKNKKPVKSPVSKCKHYNYEVPYCELRQFKHLPLEKV